MMTKTKTFLLLICASLPLTACVSREQADEYVAKGCEAAIRAFVEESFEVKAIKNKTFKTDPKSDDLRIATITTEESDGWQTLEKSYTCIFREEFGSFGNVYTASIHRFDDGNRVIGQKGYEIQGSIEEHQKLLKVTEEAMR